jgi:hypothetical protein
MRRTNRTPYTLGAILAMTLTSVASATPLLHQQFKDICKPPAGSMLELAQCRTCHSALPKLNAFGRDVNREMVRQKSKTFTPTIWNKLAPLDSDKDGVSNYREIEAGTLPGDRKSRPHTRV